MDNKEQCKKSVNGRRGFNDFGRHRCTRKVWKDGFCKQHHPDTVAARVKKSHAKWEEKLKKEPWHLLGEANKKIAALEKENQELKAKIEKLEQDCCVFEAEQKPLLCKCDITTWGGIPGPICNCYKEVDSGMCEECKHDKGCHLGSGEL